MARRVQDGTYEGTYFIRDLTKPETSTEWTGEACSSADAMRQWLGEDYADYVKQTVRKGKTSAFEVGFLGEDDRGYFTVRYYWREGKGGALPASYYKP